MHIKIDLKIFAFIILFCLTKQIEIYVLLMIFAILHEIGHLLAGVILKLKPKGIELNPFGLSITFEGTGENFKNKIQQKKIGIALAGPLVNLIIAIILILFGNSSNYTLIIYANLILFLINLLPIYPLDGGRIIKSILHMKLGHFESCKIINSISNIVTVTLTVFASILIFRFQNIAILFLIMYVWILMINENKKYELIKRMYTVIQKDKNTLEKINV